MAIRRRVNAPTGIDLGPREPASPAPLPEIPDHPLTAAPKPRAITTIANLSNSCLGLVGITGSGKTSLIVTAIEEAWEVYHRCTQFYASDLGGYGNKLLSLIRLQIARVWYIRNHVKPFETMEFASQGYWPETMLDPETGLAAPDVRLVPPRQVRWIVICPNNHPVGTFADQAQAAASQTACPTCGVITSTANALRMDRATVRSAGFKSIGHYAYDSMSQMSEYGLQELRVKSAKGELASNALGSADALREGEFVAGTGSVAQYGFMQDRVPVWLSNIRALPDQVLPPTVTFGVERSKGTDESGGIPIYGPKIAGNARTAWVPGWLGNCLYVAKEPHNPPERDDHGNVKTYHRLWLVNHPSPTEPDVPIVAKHRGEPFGMPDYLEDSGVPEEAWNRCSLRVFYKLLRDQAVAIEARDRAKYHDAPALVGEVDEPEEVLEVQAASDGTGQANALPSSTRIKRRTRVHQAAPVSSEPRGETVAEIAVEPEKAGSAAGSLDPHAPAEAGNPAGEQAAAPVDGQSSTPTGIETSPSPIVQQLQAILEAAKGNGEASEALPVFPPFDKDRDVAPPRPVAGRIRRMPRPPAE
jgi:hypothetical protein